MPPMLTWSMAGKYLAVSLPIVGLLWLVLSRRYRGHRAVLGALAIVLCSLAVALLATAYLDLQARAQTFNDPWPGVIFTAVLAAFVYHSLPVVCCGSTFAVMCVLVVGLLEIYRTDVDLEIREKPDLSESAARRKPTTVLVLSVVIGVLCTVLAITLCLLSGILSRLGQESGALAVINQDDEMVVEMAKRYGLVRAIAQYDQVIDAIDAYQRNHGVYPPDLQVLVPEYLSKAPGIYVRAGERLEYAPTPE